jgi:hypothetical protein
MHKPYTTDIEPIAPAAAWAIRWEKTGSDFRFIQSHSRADLRFGTAGSHRQKRAVSRAI